MPFPQYLTKQGIIPGIKVDTGAKPLAGFPGETITEGLDGLRERLVEYHKLGARFAKWRAVIDIGDGIPDAHTRSRPMPHALARYAALCQENGIVPIVEPEVLMDGAHTIERCEEVTNAVLADRVPRSSSRHRVLLEGMCSSPTWSSPARRPRSRAAPEQVAEATRAHACKRHVPAAVPGIAFLSGGQSSQEATLHLSLMNKLRAAALAAHLQLRPCAAGRRAQGLGRQAGQRRGRPEGVRQARQAQRPGRAAAATRPTWRVRPPEGSPSPRAQ